MYSCRQCINIRQKQWAHWSNEYINKWLGYYRTFALVHVEFASSCNVFVSVYKAAWVFVVRVFRCSATLYLASVDSREQNRQRSDYPFLFCTLCRLLFNTTVTTLPAQIVCTSAFLIKEVWETDDLSPFVGHCAAFLNVTLTQTHTQSAPTEIAAKLQKNWDLLSFFPLFCMFLFWLIRLWLTFLPV